MACQAVTNGFKCEKNKLITISADDPTMTKHVWTIDGVQESTLAQFEKTYAVPGVTHTVVHSGENACLDTCSQSTQLEIVDAITPPSTQAAAAPGASPMIVIAAVVFLGFLGFLMIKK